MPDEDPGPACPAAIGGVGDGSRLKISAGLFFVCFLLSRLFFHEAYYKIDAHALFIALLTGQRPWLHHLGSNHVLRLAYELLRPLGLTVYWSSSLVVSLGYALGVAAVFLGFLELTRRWKRAILPTVLFAICPPVFFFATVVEYHGMFVGPAGIAFYAFARFHRMPTAFRSALLGLATGLCTYFHASGFVLPFVFILWHWAEYPGVSVPWSWHRVKNVLIGTMPMMAIHLLLSLTIANVLFSFNYVSVRHSGHGLADVAVIMAQEWFMPFLPVSLLMFAAFAKKDLRLSALACLVALTPYVAASYRIITREPEMGAYFIPMALYAVWLVCRAFPSRVLPIVILVSCGFAISSYHWIPSREGLQALAAEIESLTKGRRSLVFYGSFPEFEAVTMYLPDHVACPTDLALSAPEESVRSFVGVLQKRFRQWRRSGFGVFFTERCFEFLEKDYPVGTRGGKVLAGWVRTHCVLKKHQGSRIVLWEVIGERRG